MIPRVTTRWLAVACAAAMLLAWFGRAARAGCKLAPRTMAACCCPHDRPHHRRPASPDPVLGRAGCCELHQAPLERPTPARIAARAELAGGHPVVAVATLAPLRHAGRAHPVSGQRGRGPPGNAHDHLLAKSARLL